MMNVSLTNEVTPNPCTTLRYSDLPAGNYRDPLHSPSTPGNLNISHHRYLHKQSRSRAEGLLEALMKLRNNRKRGHWGLQMPTTLNKSERATLIHEHAVEAQVRYGYIRRDT
jgi:hypothetical protein